MYVRIDMKLYAFFKTFWTMNFFMNIRTYVCMHVCMYVYIAKKYSLFQQPFLLLYLSSGISPARLGSISVSEGKLCRQANANTSQKGNYSNFRNEKLGYTPVEVG